MDIRRCRALQLGVGFAVTAALPLPLSLTHTVNQPPKVVSATKSLANEFFLIMGSGMHKHQKDHVSEYSLLTNGIRDETDTASQIRLVEQMIVARVNALVLAPANSKVSVPVVKKAVDAGIFVTNIDNRLDPAALKEEGLNVPFVGPNNRRGVRLVGDFVAKSLRPGNAVGIIEGISATTNAQQRITDFEGAAEAVKPKIAGAWSGEWEIDREDKAAAAMLRSEPDLKALLCDNDNMAIDAVSAVRATGKPGKVLIGGYDNTDAIKAVLTDGRVVATADQHANQQAVYDIETALKALVSKTPQTKPSGVAETPVNLVTHS